MNYGSLAILENNILKKELFFETKDLAGELVEKLDFIYEEFDYIVVSSGPGSWTGIRIGISFAKGLVLGNKDKIYVVNVFDSLFYSVKDIKEKFIGIVYAFKDIFYYSNFKGRFNYKKSFKIKKITLKKLISTIEKEKSIIIGPGILNLSQFISIEKIPTINFLWYPRASINGILAYEKIKRGIKSTLPEPIYGK
ncbi:MAG: hypothetical protein N2589_02645 [bacterium]|nr:hypothetical protein [bacterium]